MADNDLEGPVIERKGENKEFERKEGPETVGKESGGEERKPRGGSHHTSQNMNHHVG